MYLVPSSPPLPSFEKKKSCHTTFHPLPPLFFALSCKNAGWLLNACNLLDIFTSALRMLCGGWELNLNPSGYFSMRNLRKLLFLQILLSLAMAYHPSSNNQNMDLKKRRNSTSRCWKLPKVIHYSCNIEFLKFSSMTYGHHYSILHYGKVLFFN